MKRRDLFIALCVLVLGGGVTFLWRNAYSRIELSPEILARDYVQITGRNGMPGNLAARWKHYWDRWPGDYHVGIQPIGKIALTNAVLSYSTFARRPVWVHREIASLGIGAINVSAYTYEGVIRKMEAALLTNGVVCRYDRNLNVTVMRKKSDLVLTSNMFVELPEAVTNTPSNIDWSDLE